MITMLTSGSHAYTHDPLKSTGRFDFVSLSYNRVFRAKTLSRGTYIFGDLDRLSYWELELAARLYQTLKIAGLKVLNNPARLRQRLSLLRGLAGSGFNRFGAWAVDDPARPSRYPMFLRTQCAHRGPLSDLLHDEAAIAAAIEKSTGEGVPMREMMLVEYCAEPLRQGLFRKLATFRIGNRMLSTLCVHERTWAAKYGEIGVADANHYEDEYDIIASNRYGESLRPAFEVGEIEYGRADFSLVEGKPQVYEINSNPSIESVGEHPFPIRMKADALFFDKLYDAFAEIDTIGAGQPVAIDDEVLALQRRRDRFVARARWTP